MAELHTHQIQFISSVAGGPVSDTTTEMRESHAHLDIATVDFDAFVHGNHTLDDAISLAYVNPVESRPNSSVAIRKSNSKYVSS